MKDLSCEFRDGSAGLAPAGWLHISKSPIAKDIRSNLIRGIEVISFLLFPGSLNGSLNMTASEHGTSVSAPSIRCSPHATDEFAVCMWKELGEISGTERVWRQFPASQIS